MDDEQKQIDMGRIADQYLQDPAMAAAFEKIAGLNYAEFLSATPDKAVAIQSRARALEDLKNEMRVMVDNGKIAERKREQRLKAEKSRAK